MSALNKRYFEKNRLNLRRLRHDLLSTIEVASTMVQLGKEKPERRAQLDPMLEEAISRFLAIHAALGGNETEEVLKSDDLVELTDKPQGQGDY